VLVEVGEHRPAVDALERDTAVAHRVQQPRLRGVVQAAAGEHRTALGALDPVPQQRAGGREPEPAAGQLLEDLLGGEAAQHPAQVPRVGTHLPGELLRGARAVGQLVGDPQLGRDPQQLGHDVTVGEPGEPRIGRHARQRYDRAARATIRRTADAGLLV
jgi:hypothetical protein